MPEKSVEITKKKKIRNLRVLVLGFAFKENCPDIRNTKIYEFFK